ncbi:type II toxin-antitoxin system RelE/ParE family toxin [archaeon]|jgi:hypothetical protein|nr:type II toxin-antitoxin system RelE/ParE family toxin [archaeon]
MTKWILEQTELFEKKFLKLIPKNLQEEVKNQIKKLTNNPYNSKPLGYKFFREKKIKKWRIYFLIYEDKLVVYFIDISDKKLQQYTIDKIKSDFDFLKEYIENKYKSN